LAIEQRSQTMQTLLEPDVARETPPEPIPTSEPRTTAPEFEDLQRPRWWLSTPALLATSMLLVLVANVAAINNAPPKMATAVGWLAALLFGATVVVALFRVVAGAVALIRPSSRPVDFDGGATLVAVLGNLVMTVFGMLVAYIGTVGFSRGRQLRRFGRVLLPRLRSSSEWTTSEMVIDAEGAPAGLADQWRENGKTEHASVAAFARLTLDLMALGAPPALVAAANRDALDEIRHAELCFSIARALDGRTESPAPFPEAQRVGTLPRSRTLALGKLAVDSLVDGALHEGVSARVIAKLSQRSAVPAIAAALKGIAADEGRHTAHGWAVVEWCLDEGGAPVAEALFGALAALPGQMSSTLPAGASGGEWERWGIHGHALEAAEYTSALEQLGRRVRSLIPPRADAAA
jgi:hypothetical protein